VVVSISVIAAIAQKDGFHRQIALLWPSDEAD